MAEADDQCEVLRTTSSNEAELGSTKAPVTATEQSPTENGTSARDTIRGKSSSHSSEIHSDHRRRSSKAHKQPEGDEEDRPMGHYPPRRESRQESPPTAFIDIHAQSQFHGSWQEISHQFEEQVGKPSKEALHRFFYPPGNGHSHGHHHHSSPRRPSKAQMSDRDRERLKEKAKLKREKSESSDNTNADEAVPSSPHDHDPPVVDSDQGSSSEPQVQVQQQEPQQSAEQSTPNQTSTRVLQRSNSGQSSVDSLALCESLSFQGQPPSLPTFQQSFAEEEEQDRKYVESFWRVYDDVIMLSLFTQLGVVARLAASTWFTFFDGVFRADSPLFTNLPLNCFSCFLLGFMGSGDRLMEMITTRFTPRNLQQTIVRGADSDDEVDDDELYDGQQSKNGLRQRRRRPKRARQEEHFHSWQPPLHWHDDFREVQLLALERRIRASKCLVLFPVMKEDADVMEHYFGEGYKASAEKEKQQRSQRQQQRRSTTTRRRRRHFGRQRYSATNLADTDENMDFSASSEVDFSEEEVFDAAALERTKSGESVDDDQDLYVDHGHLRFDLELTESTLNSKSLQGPAVNDLEGQAQTDKSSSPASSLPPSVQKLIKRAPGRTTNAASSTSPVSAAEHSTSQQVRHVGVSAAASQSIQSSQPQPQTAPVRSSDFGAHSPGDSPTEYGVQMVNLKTSASSSADARPYPNATNLNGTSDQQQTLQEADGGQEDDPQLEHIISNVQANVSENISRIRRVNLADGWDVGTTPEAMADDLMLGLRDGFCGALSSFSSWNSSMLNLLREGHVGEAVVGYMLGIQLPIVSYRFGQQMAVYFFVWRCRRETKRAERMGGYGIRLRMDDDDDDGHDESSPRRERDGSLGKLSGDEDFFEDERSRAKSGESSLDASETEIPSVRAICTALYLLSLVTQFTSLSFFSDPEDQQIALSLLFSPFGTLTRWRLSRFNCWHPGFPLGTFTCNIVACALGGSLGSLLAGNPGPEERVLLQSFIAGFGGTLSSLATFIVEILAGMDPLLFRFDGFMYAASSLGWALLVGFVFSASVDWADETT